VFHFGNLDSTTNTLWVHADLITPGYTAVFNGFAAQSSTGDANINNAALANAVFVLNSLGVTNLQYAPTAAIGVTAAGDIYNMNPASATTVIYDPLLDMTPSP
jgi:hypothetical protein